ncbi:exopolyphosphatase [Nocardioides sp.]|uniref:Ppx/GppA phosphatase family protein n=1 Tax=Nocardioides sp. TaxID=35761 RepID=UPI003D0EFE07
MRQPLTVAAIDCGTNTIKLLIGALPAVSVHEARMVRLGQGVDRTGRLADEALERTFAAIDEFAALIATHQVDRIRFCATSASRDASNAAVFVAGVRERLGVEPEVISGDEEAALAFSGALRGLSPSVPRPVLIVDVGGGSTELILGTTAPQAAHSMDIGSVRLHERHLHSDPPTAAEIAAAVSDIDAALDACPVDPAAAAAVVGIAGTACTVVAGVLDLPAYDRDRIDQATVSVAAVQDFVRDLVAMPVAERLSLPYLHPGRADVIGAGALIVSRVLVRTNLTSMTASESDILEGIAWSLVED